MFIDSDVAWDNRKLWAIHNTPRCCPSWTLEANLSRLQNIIRLSADVFPQHLALIGATTSVICLCLLANTSDTFSRSRYGQKHVQIDSFRYFFFSSYYNSPAQFCKLSLNAVRNRRGIFDLSFSRAFVAIGRAYSSFAAGVETVWKIHTVCTKNFSPRDCQAAKRIFSRLVSLEIGCIAWICAVVLDILQHGRRLSRDSKTWSVNVRDYLFNDSPTRARAQFANLFHIRDYL